MSKQDEDIALGNWKGRAEKAEARIAELEAEKERDLPADREAGRGGVER